LIGILSTPISYTGLGEVSKVLLTGFGPWGSEKYNPSAEIALGFNNVVIGGYRVVGVVLPVSYRRVISDLPEILVKIKPDIALHIGLAPKSCEVRVERVAINLMYSEKGDVDGFKPVDEPIVPGGPVAYFATLPTRRIVERLKEEGIPAVLSYSAGTFLCNCAMYVSLHTIAAQRLETISGFIHIPYIPQQAVGKSAPSMCLHLSRKAVEIAVKESIDYLKQRESSKNR